MKNSLFSIIAVFCLCSCSLLPDLDKIKGNDENGGGSGKGSVTISNISASYSRITGIYTISVDVSASGVAESEIKSLGFMASTSSNGESNSHKGFLRGSTSGTATMKSSSLSANTTYYIKGFLETSSGTVYSSVKTVRTPSK